MKSSPSGNASETKPISPADLQALLSGDGPYALLDVRERGEYAFGHIGGAVTLTRGLLEVCVDRLIPDRRVRVVLYCDDGYRSGLAAQTLTGLGYYDVSVLVGGLEEWRASGRPTSYGVNVLGKDYGERVAVQNGIPQLDVDELLDLQCQGPVLILDSRTEEEHIQGHIPGALNVPGGELPVIVPSLLERQTVHAVVVHCAGRTRSILGVDLLRRMGIENVYALRNGTMAWLLAGHQLESGSGGPIVRAVAEGARDRAAAFADRFAGDAGAASIGVDELQRIRDSGEAHYVIDVRLPAEFRQARLPGAISCPAGQLANAADEYIAIRQALVVCQSNGTTRAKIGAGTLRRIGYPHVAWLDAGLSGWSERGLQTDSGASAETSIAGLDVAERETEDVAPSSLTAQSDGLHIIDVRRSSEFAAGHIEGARWVPRGDLERRIGRYVPSIDANVVVVSDRGVRAALAASTLQRLGYRRVRRMLGGVEAWKAQGRMLVDGLDGADVSLLEAKEDAGLIRARVLEPDRGDMVRYLAWEENLGEKYLAPDSHHDGAGPSRH